MVSFSIIENILPLHIPLEMLLAISFCWCATVHNQIWICTVAKKIIFFLLIYILFYCVSGGSYCLL